MREGRTSHRDRLGHGLTLPLHLRLPHPPTTNVGRQPSDASDVRPLHLKGRTQQAGLWTQAQVSLLPRRAESKRRSTNQFLTFVLTYFVF